MGFNTGFKGLIRVSLDTNFKSNFQDIFVDFFLITPKNKGPEIVNKYVDILLSFATSYLCVAAFSTTKKMKSNNRPTLCALDSAMRVDISTVRPRIENYINYTRATSLIDKISSKYTWGTRWRSWFRHCATIQKVAGSIPDGVIGLFH